MTREQVAERARRAIPDFLLRKKPDPPKVKPKNQDNPETSNINWDYLFKLAEDTEYRRKGDQN